MKRAPESSTRLASAAPAMALLLLRLEADAFADARACPFCDAAPNDDDDDSAPRLPHTLDCELDRVLLDSGLRTDAELVALCSVASDEMEGAA